MHALSVQEPPVAERGDEQPWEERARWGARQSPSELLAVLADKMDRFERDIASLRREVLDGRSEFRGEMERKIGDLNQGKADTFRVRVLETIVYGFVGIILVAVAYALLEARPVIPTERPAVGGTR